MAEPQGFIAVKPELVADAGIQLLIRENALAATVWRDAFRDFRGRKEDTITLRLPAYVEANRRALRSNDPRVRSKLHERKVNVTLSHDLQVDVPLTDEEQTLDLESIARQVTAPSVAGIVRGYEDEIASLMQDADYAVELEMDPDRAWEVAFDANTALNDASVPRSGRFLALGSNLENLLVKSDRLNKVNESGSSAALRDATIGRLAGFDRIFGSNSLGPDEAYAYHRSAFALGTAAPVVPRGVAWGATQSRDGFAIRVMEHLTDTGTDLENVVYHDAWVGSASTPDAGTIAAGTGKFVPAVDPDPEGSDELFVRAVKITLAGTDAG